MSRRPELVYRTASLPVGAVVTSFPSRSSERVVWMFSPITQNGLFSP